MKKFLEEFKTFAMRGNMIDLAVGMIIGTAFTALVTALVDDLINPVLGVFTGNIDFSNLFISLDGNEYATLADAEAAGASVFKYGSFISSVINFVIMAFVVFLLVKALNKLNDMGKKEEQPAEATTKKCPFCMSEIDIKATRCPNCTSLIDVGAEVPEAAKAEA